MKWKKKDVSYDAWQVPARVTCEDPPPWAREELDKPADTPGTRMDVLHRIGDRHRIPTGIGVYNDDDAGSMAEPGDWITRGPDGRMRVWDGGAFELWHEPDQPDAEGRMYLHMPAGAGKTETQGRTMTEKEKAAAREFLDTGYVESKEASSPEPWGIVFGDGDSMKAWQAGGDVRFAYSGARPGPGQSSSLSALLSIGQAIMLASQLKDAARHAEEHIANAHP